MDVARSRRAPGRSPQFSRVCSRRWSATRHSSVIRPSRSVSCGPTRRCPAPRLQRWFPGSRTGSGTRSSAACSGGAGRSGSSVSWLRSVRRKPGRCGVGSRLRSVSRPGSPYSQRSPRHFSSRASSGPSNWCRSRFASPARSSPDDFLVGGSPTVGLRDGSLRASVSRVACLSAPVSPGSRARRSITRFSSSTARALPCRGSSRCAIASHPVNAFWCRFGSSPRPCRFFPEAESRRPRS